MNNENEISGAIREEDAAAVSQQAAVEPEVPVMPEQAAVEPEVPVTPEQEDPWAVFREEPDDAFSNPFEPKKADAAPQANVPYGAAQPQGYVPPQGAAQPQSAAQPQGYVPPQGYAPYGYAPRPGYGQPYGYAPQGYVPYGQVPPQSGIPAQPYNAYGTPAQNEPKKGGAGQVLMWIAAILIEAVIVCFAIYGIYALATKDNAGPNPGVNQGPQIPSMPDRNDDSGSSSRPEGSNPSSNIGENPTDVQMGVVCGQMNEQYAEYYGLEPGLVVQSFSSDSPAKAAGLQLDDVITSANGIRVKTFDELFAIMQKMKPGDEMKLECYRLVRSEENIWGFKASEPFTITFTMQAKHEDTSSTPSTPSYPGA
jgi:hypothetical protein